MTLTNTYTNSTLYTGNGATVDFSTRFLFAANSEVLVYKILISTGVETLQTETTHYTLVGAGTGAAGTVTFLTAPASTSYVQVRRATAQTQATDYVEGTTFPAATHEAALDKLTRIVQELDDKIDRAPLLTGSSVNYPLVFPDFSSATGSNIVRVNSAGTALELATAVNASLNSAITPTDDVFIVGNGTAFVGESGATARTSLGLGSMATQAASAVAITGGTVVGITDITVADGGTGSSTAAGAATNLGLGTGDTPQLTGVNIGHASDTTVTRASAGDLAVEGNIVYRAGGTDVPVADGGTGSSTAAGARTNLGVVIGTDVQAYDAELAAIAGLTSAADKGIQFTGAGTAAVYDLTAAGKALLDDADASAQRTTLGLAIGTNVQAYDADLAALAGLTSAADKAPYFTGSGTADVMTVTTAARTVLDDATVAAMVDTLGGASSTGTGGIARATSPTFVTPVLGAATATSINGVIPTAATTTVGASVALPEGTDNGSHKIVIKAAPSMAADYTLELPNAVPAGNGYTLSVTTGGVATWAAPGAAGAGGATTNVQVNSSGALGGDANFTYDSAGTAFLGTALDLGHATDTTLTRSSAGNVAIEGNVVYRAGGTDVPVTDGGTGLSTLTTAYGVVCAGTTATGALQNAGAGTAGQVLTSNGAAALPTFQTGPSYTFISSAAASASASLAFTSLTSAYSEYVFVLSHILPVTDDVDLWIRTSTDNGSSYAASAGNYSWSAPTAQFGTSAVSFYGSNADTKIQLTATSAGYHIDNNAGSGWCGTVHVIDPSAAANCKIQFKGAYNANTGLHCNTFGGGLRLAAADVDAVQFLMSSGNIASGTIYMYGVKNT